MPVLTTEEVLREEAREIHGEDRIQAILRRPEFAATAGAKTFSDSTGKDLYRVLNELNSAALCLSGGGIRSASFSLGVIQALASHPRRSQDERDAGHSLLAAFHYLSTVSGGGYIGSWFSAWVKRLGFVAVWQGLAGARGRPENEAAPIAWLRSYSNFLTPRLGLTSADTWAAAALVLRNLVLNWLVILPALCVVLIVLKLFAGGVEAFAQFSPLSCGPYAVKAGLAGVALVIVALAFTNHHRPTRGKSQASQRWVLWLDLLPATVAGIAFVLALASPCAEILVRSRLGLPVIQLPLIPGLVVVGMAVYAIAWVLATPRWRGFRDFFGDLVAWIVAGAVHGALIAGGIYLYFELMPSGGVSPFQPKEVLLLVFGVPWALAAHLSAEMTWVGLTSWEDGSDADREWLARAAGWFLVTLLALALFMFLVFAGSRLVGELYGQVKAWLVAGGAGVITAWLGKSSASPAQGKAHDRSQFWANAALAVAGPVFVGALVIALSAILDSVLFGKALIGTESFTARVVAEGFPGWPGARELLAALVVIGALGAVASRFVNINRFSLHALYRNRLVRAFLGASNKDRNKDRNTFTDFAESDNVRMHELWPAKPGAAIPAESSTGWRPLHVINIALNIVSSKKLAWQERKAETFTVTPLHAGSACGGAVTDGTPTSLAPGAFRSSRQYGGDKGISLGTAMAISGAAASPNMGYHSSPSLAILLTLFNVRLGWWLGNPGQEGKHTCEYEGPRSAIVPLLSEMFGQTTDDNRYVYLSDGGHFENLGLYEMVRRRCRFIVVVDAGCDMKFEFEDLGNAVRKIRIDLGLEITFRGLGALRHRPTENFSYEDRDPPFHAIGTVHYHAADGGGQDGRILYLKPGFHRNRLQDVGVANYALRNPDFPHESTGDQSFSESQLESYRALGFDITDDVLRQVFTDPTLPTNPKIEEVFDALDKTLREFPASETSPMRPTQAVARTNQSGA